MEHGHDAEGCGEWPGVVERLKAPVLPHMGWNTVDAPAGTVLFDGLADERFYFVHSYGVRDFPLAADGPPSPLAKPKVTWAEHGDRFVAGVENGAAVGHPVPPREERGRRRPPADATGWTRSPDLRIALCRAPRVTR